MKRILVCLALILCALAASAMVKIGGMDYVTITNAVANANDGDTILIATGVYNEAVNIFGKDLVLDGGYTNDCAYKIAGAFSVIDANDPIPLGGWGSALDITGSVVALKNLHIQGGEWAPLAGVGYGGGLDIRSSSIVTASFCRVYDNYALGKGGGVYVEDSFLYLVGTEVESNRTYLASGLFVTPYGWGGGLCAERSQVEVGGASPFSLNWAASAGGGLCGSDSRLYLHDSSVDISDNTASNGGGIAVFGGVLEVANSSDIHRNVASNNGGGLLLGGGATGILRGASTTVGTKAAGPNRALAGSGGGIYASNTFLVVSNNAGVFCNTAASAGGGVFLLGSTCVVDNADIGVGGSTNGALAGGGMAAINSRVEFRGGATVAGSQAFVGGGVYATNSTVILGPAAVIGDAQPTNANFALGGGGLFADMCAVTLEGKVWNNTGIGGAGVGLMYCSLLASNAQLIGNIGSTNPTAFGGGLAMTGGTGLFHNVTVSSNLCYNGGGIALLEGAQGDFKSGSLVAYNFAGGNGGGLFLQSTSMVYMSQPTVRSNFAVGNGGGLCIVTGEVELTDGQFQQNACEGEGGGLYASNAAVGWLVAEDTYLNYNFAQRAGGAIAAAGQADIQVLAVSNFFVAVNRSWGNGGGVAVDNASFWGGGRVNVGGNSADVMGGGAFVKGGGVLTCVPLGPGFQAYFYNNRIGNYGGGICATGTDSTVGLSGARIGLSYTGIPTPNTAVGALTGDGGGGLALLAGSRANLADCWVMHNVSSNQGGGIQMDGAYLIMQSGGAITPGDFVPPNRIMYNRATNNVTGQGGGIHARRSTVLIEDCLIYSNRAARGGGLHVDTPSTAKVVNAVFLKNYATVTGGAARVYGSGSHADFLHCTILFNGFCGINVDSGAEASLTNCIVGGNLTEQVTAGQSVSYSDVAAGYPGTGNIDLDPLLIASDDFDVRLGYGSPCINSGKLAAAVTADAIGEPRPFGPEADMGAYEYNGDFYDTDGDHMFDGWEADHGLDPWVDDALANSDPDPYLNIEEFISDTDPFDGSSHLKIESITNGATRDVSFLSSTARVYALFATPFMTNDATWTIVGTNFALYGNGGLYTAIDTNAPDGHAFYRLDVQVP